MRKERTLNVAKALTVQLRATEEAIDSALSEAAHLIDAYVTSRRALHLSPMIGGDVHENTLKAMTALNTAQRYMTAAHDSLGLIQTKLGIEAMVDPYKDGQGSGTPPVGGGITNYERPTPLTS